MVWVMVDIGLITVDIRPITVVKVAVMAVVDPPVVYVQQQGGVQAATKSQTDYWRYCSNPKGYYPHVKKCPDGWMQVVSQLSPAQ